MGERRRLNGRVVDGHGEGVAGAVLMVVRGTAPTPEIGIVAGAAGRFAIALPEGRFTIRAVKDGVQAESDVTVGAGAPDIEIRLGEG